MHLDPELQVHALADELLDIPACRHADALQLLAALADDDAFLRVAVDDDGGMDDHQPSFLVLLERLDEHRRRVGDFRSGKEKNLLADDFAAEKTLAGVGGDVLREEAWAVGKQAQDLGKQAVDTVVTQGRDGHDSREGEEPGVGLDHRQEQVAVHAVDLVEHKDGWAGDLAKAGNHFLPLFLAHLLGERQGDIDEKKHHINLGEAVHGDFHHLHIERFPRAVQSRGVEEDHLVVRFVDDADDAVAGSLRLRGDDGNLLAEKAVEQG